MQHPQAQRLDGTVMDTSFSSHATQAAILDNTFVRYNCAISLVHSKPVSLSPVQHRSHQRGGPTPGSGPTDGLRRMARPKARDRPIVPNWHQSAATLTAMYGFGTGHMDSDRPLYLYFLSCEPRFHQCPLQNCTIASPPRLNRNSSRDPRASPAAGRQGVLFHGCRLDPCCHV